jgi:hypothetical protein
LYSRIQACAAGLALCLSANAWAGDFMDTRLSFVFADDNVLASAGETTPNSPSAKFGAGNQNTQFYDNFNTRFSGFETLSHLALYKKEEGFLPGLTAEAALVVLALEQSNGAVGLTDDSSYVRLTYRPASWGHGEGIALTGFPVNADRFRLGYAYRVTWGGTSAFTSRAASNSAPGVKLQVTRDRWYAFVGAKTALILNDLIHEQETNYGFLAGAGVDILPTLRLEANGGYFQKGIIPDLAASLIRAPVNAAGISAEAVYHVGVPVGTSVDLKLYKNDPNVYERFFSPEAYPGGLSYSVSVEGDYLRQTLEDPDVFGKTVAQPAYAVALQARLKHNFLRAHMLGLVRSLSYIQFDTPGIPPYKDFPSASTNQPEMFIAAGVDYFLPKLHLTPGIIAGVQRPATLKTETTLLGGNTPPPSLTGEHVLVFRDVNRLEILPTGKSALPVISAKVNAKMDISESFAAVAEVYYNYDYNRTTFLDTTSGVSVATFSKPHELGFNVILQARF